MIAVDQYLQQKCGYIGSILDSKQQPRFMLPNLQRSFKWNEKRIEALWSDLNDYRHVNNLTKSFDYGPKNPDFNTTPPYLLGTIYVTEGEGNGDEKVRQLIDGQQRLTTISISVMVLKEIYAALGEDKGIREELRNLDNRLEYTVAELFANAEKILVDRKTPNLIYPQENNNAFWKKLCTSNKHTQFQKVLNEYDRDSETQKNIAEAFNIIRNCISNILNDEDFHKGENIVWKRPTKKNPGKWDVSGIARLVASHDVKGFEEVIINFAGLLAVLLDCICVVQFTCTSEQQVSLFDIINNRGEPFDMPDMVRLMLFSHTKKTLHDELNKVWTASKVDKDLLSWVWNAFYAKEPSNLAKQKLQLQIEKNLDDKDNTDSIASQWAMEFADRCNKCSKCLAGINSKAFNETQFSDRNFYKVAFLTSNEYVKFSRPIFFALENSNIESEDQKADIYRYLLNFIVRVAITKEKDTRSVGNVLPKLAVIICQIINNASDGLESFEKIKQAIASSSMFQLVDDDNFVGMFRKFSLGSHSARFGYLIIGSLENAKSGNKAATKLTYYSNDDAIQSNNLEHIFPQTPEKNTWPEADVANVEHYIGMIGNLLPINKDANSKIKNKGIRDKIAVYAEQHLSMWPDLEKAIMTNSDGSSQPSWTIAKIEERTAKLADEARKVFALN